MPQRGECVGTSRMEVQSRRSDLQRFYEILAVLERRIGGARILADCSGHRIWKWPLRGVYFFEEPGEQRSDTGFGLRVVRVGSHALNAGEHSKLWDRLKAHKGANREFGGNHRGSVFRKHVGKSLIRRDFIDFPTWGQGSSASKSVIVSEKPLEKVVSCVIGAMPFLWLEIDDEPGHASLRGYIERNSIALLSNLGKLPLDPPSDCWLGRWSDNEKVQESGLWNHHHVGEPYQPEFLDTFAVLVDTIGKR